MELGWSARYHPPLLAALIFFFFFCNFWKAWKFRVKRNPSVDGVSEQKGQSVVWPGGSISRLCLLFHSYIFNFPFMVLENTINGYIQEKKTNCTKLWNDKFIIKLILSHMKNTNPVHGHDCQATPTQSDAHPVGGPNTEILIKSAVLLQKGYNRKHKGQR